MNEETNNSNEELKPAAGQPAAEQPAETSDEALKKELEAALASQDGEEENSAPADDSQDGGDDKPANEEKPAETPAIPDELAERAVKAGLSLADAKSFASQEALERVCTALEAKAEKPGDGNPAGGEETPNGGNGEGGEAFDPASIPELTDEEYDPGLVKAYNALRSLAVKQNEQIQELRKLARAGESARAQDRFSMLVETLDEGVRKSLDAASRSALKKKFDVLSAGYKAAKAEMKDEDVFKEAAQIALGDRLRESAAAKKEEALKKRQSLRLAAPGGVPGKTQTNGGDDADMAELVAKLETKFG